MIGTHIQWLNITPIFNFNTYSGTYYIFFIKIPGQIRLSEAKLTIGKLELENEQLKIELKTADNVQHPIQPTIYNENDTLVPKERIEYMERLEVDFIDLKDELNQLRTEKSELLSKIAKFEVK